MRALPFLLLATALGACGIGVIGVEANDTAGPGEAGVGLDADPGAKPDAATADGAETGAADAALDARDAADARPPLVCRTYRDCPSSACCYDEKTETARCEYPCSTGIYLCKVGVDDCQGHTCSALTAPIPGLGYCH